MIRLATFLLLTFLFIHTPLHTQNTNTGTIVSAIVVQDNNINGGGFQSDVTITEDGMTVYSSADVSGIFKSTDGGLRFENINEGLETSKVASLAITPDNDQILYAGTGNQGNSGGLFRSCNGGESWELTADGDSALFSGNHSNDNDPVPDGHPRSNGDLIVIDAGMESTSYMDDIVIAGTYKDGVVIFEQGGDLKKADVLGSGFVRSVANHADVPNIVYAAVQFEDSSLNGIYRIDYTDLSNVNETLVFPTLRPEGLTMLGNGHVFGAIGKEGIVKFNGSNWSIINSDQWIDNGFREWTAVCGYLKGNTDVIYAGLNNLGGNGNGTNYSTIWRKIGGQDWVPLVDVNSNVSDIVYGQSYPWWFRIDAFQQAGLGRKNSIISSIDVALGDFDQFVSDDIIYVSGRGGIWKSPRRDEMWQPAVYNMQATSNNGVAVNPNDPTQVALSNTDYVVLETSNRFEDDAMTRDKPLNAESKGFDVIFDVVSNEVIVGVGDRDNNRAGNVFVKDAGMLGDGCNSCWLNTDVEEASDGGRVRAITYGYHNGNSNTSQTILAAVENEGVYRYHNGQWTESDMMDIKNTKGSNFVWPDKANSGTVYLLDLSSGLHRSTNGGQNWSNLWPSMNFNNNDFFNSGYITADENDPETLYISIQGRSNSPIGLSHKVYRMSNAATVNTFGSPLIDNKIVDIALHSGNSIIKRPGPLVFGLDGKLWLTQQQNSQNSIDAALFVMENPKSDLFFTDLTTKKYRNVATQPNAIDVANDGYVYIAQNGIGLVKIQYASGQANIQLSPTCIEVLTDPSNNLYTVSGILPSYTIEILDALGTVHSTLCNENSAVSFDINTLSSGTYVIRVSDPNNNLLHVEQIIKF